MKRAQSKPPALRDNFTGLPNIFIKGIQPRPRISAAKLGELVKKKFQANKDLYQACVNVFKTNDVKVLKTFEAEHKIGPVDFKDLKLIKSKPSVFWMFLEYIQRQNLSQFHV